MEKCVNCGEIDPHPIHTQPGSLEVEGVWTRVACDVTHLNNQKFVSAVDCGPSRFAFWQKVPREGQADVVASLERLFKWYGPPEEILADNGLAFRSRAVEELCKRWGVTRLFRAANQPQGNGIVERNHGTIKRMQA